MKITSAYANKLLKQLSEDKSFWLNKENESSTYVAAEGEKPVIPDYDYAAVAAEIAAIDRKMLAVKHAVNLSNATTLLDVQGKKMTVDQILVRMAQLTDRKFRLDALRKKEPQERLNSQALHNRVAAPEFRYINYDLEQVKQDFEAVSKELMELQIALDYHNQTEQFEAEI